MVMTLSRGCGLPPNPRCGLPRSRASLITPLGGNTTDWRAGCGRSARPVRREGECFLALSLPLSTSSDGTICSGGLAVFGGRRSLWLSIAMLVALAANPGSLAASARRWAKAMRSATAAYEQADFTTAKRQLAVAVKQAAKFDLGDPRAIQTLNA